MSGLKEFTFAEYAAKAAETAVYPGQGTFLGLIYVSLKGAAEAGEFAENVGKAIRDDDILDIDMTYADKPVVFVRGLTVDRRHKLIGELGDQLWYIAMKAAELGTTLGEVAAANVDNLERRAREGKIKGSGSDR